jgi:hypothetical protein
VTEPDTQGFFPLDALVDKATVDNGFDRRPERHGDISRFRSTHHFGEVLVDLSGKPDGIRVWVGRRVFSVQLLDVSDVELVELPASCPWAGSAPVPGSLVSLRVAGVRVCLAKVQPQFASVFSSVAIRIIFSAVPVRISKSLLSLRNRPSQAKLRSTTQGFERTAHPSLILVEMCKTSPSVSSTNFTAVPG